MTVSRSIRVAASVLVAACLLAALLVALMDWNLLREPIARRISASLGRSFAIDGDLEVHLALHPRIVAHDVHLANVPGAHEPDMAQVKRLEFTVDLLQLLAGRLAFPEVALSQPRVALEVDRNGAANWHFGQHDE